MKRVLIVIVLVTLAAIAGLWRANSRSNSAGNQASSANAQESAGDAREEIHRTFQLSPGAEIAVTGINGKVDIQTSDTSTAEVYVLRTARSRESLDRRRVVIEQTSAGLVVRAESNNVSWWKRIFSHNPNEEVTIKAPRQIALALKGINGRVNGGEIEGPIEVKGINGRVELRQAKGSAKVSGINGNITMGLQELDERGVQASGINGSLELRLANGLNADLVAKGINGRLRSDIPEVPVGKGEYGSRYSARIGNGGSPINVSGINGNVILSRMAIASAPGGAAQDKKMALKEKAAL
ncbi:MAG: hypothetical protein ABI596_10080 [Pyrinomonadaceae bacterium]